ncbi:MAG: branched-chain amino acid transaminase [Cyclobacteriaceae bacterium]|nr:branched-chain amino acid transaminase [Cyclobacteriaceae bacterium]MCB9238318.1 branched-chain amino acid transaminase [Flammeovirgaceae bacterium]MCB0499042.1 branched-chain amino acid transaminase [Cyclobacteriaceae bacterium]MCO5272000.1 branched-chain amino acid transaminase [Cyclobacteriaceae bacterium]MCW5902964.1 branched-chain amino acid transaminase [Cyclobacteriaceae bacterium]
MYYTNDTILFLDGKFVKASEAKTDLFSQTLHYGYGVFEGIRAYHTVNGVKIFKAHDHYKRLLRSASLVGIPLHYSPEELTQATYEVLARNHQSNAYIRPLVFCSPNMSLTSPHEVSLMIATWKWDKYLGDQLLKVCVSSYQRPNPKSFKVEAKACGHYVNSILATTEAKQRGFDEGLLLDMDGFVAEGPGANFFYEKDGVLYTPPRGSILPGITRQTVLEICAELDLKVVEKLFKPEDLFEADSAFFCGTAAEVIGIESVEGQKFGKPWKESLGAIVQEAYQCLVLDKSYSYVIV